MREITSTQDKLRLQLQTARLVADAAARIRFENIDKDNFLLILAPVSGVITDVTSTQPGDKIQANTPLGGIAPKDARPVLKIEIAEHDRAFLHEGPAGQAEVQRVSVPALWPDRRHARVHFAGDQAEPAEQAAGVRGPRHARSRLLPDGGHELSVALRHDGDARRSSCASGG